jgi:hypothetical protein
MIKRIAVLENDESNLAELRWCGREIRRCNDALRALLEETE